MHCTLTTTHETMAMAIGKGNIASKKETTARYERGVTGRAYPHTWILSPNSPFRGTSTAVLEADNISGSAAINWVGTQLNSAAANETDARVVRMESNAIVRA